MTKNFNKFCDSIVKELFTAKSKRRISAIRHVRPIRQKKRRYVNPTTDVRAVRPRFTAEPPSQETKIGGKQQYTGNYWKVDGVRGRNKSAKGHDAVGIAKGLGGRLRIKGVNPKKPGSRVNSKQGNMEVKFTLPNGVSKIGSRIKTEFKPIRKIFSKED